MLRAKRMLSMGVRALAVFSLALLIMGMRASALTSADLLLSENVGASLVLDTKVYNESLTDKFIFSGKEEEVDEIYRSDLVMADVKSTLNVRAEADINSKIVGLIYKDCGGIVLERGEEWSLIQSGELVGYASNEYLLFDEEAEALAKDVGTMTAVGTGDVTFIRSEPDVRSKFYGFISKNAILEVVDDNDEEWICVAFDEYDAYVQRQYVKVKFNIDHGETMETIEARKRAEEEYRKSLQKQREAMMADENIERLLAALIQCEAGGEPYEGMVAVGAVVMNRVRSPAYPSTVYDVIYASGQFTPAKTGFLQRVYNSGPKEICYQAAREALGGYTNVGDMTHFRRAGTKEGFVIGHHVFY